MSKEIKEILYCDMYNDLDDKKYEKLLNYITNLQKENEKLKEEIEHYKIMFSNYFYEELYPNENEEDCIYKSRNEKAVEYCKKEIKYIHQYFENADSTDLIKILNILEGDDEE